MKRFEIFFFLFLIVGIFFFSCSKKDNQKIKDEQLGGAVNPSNLPSSGGKTLEMILVIPDNDYTGKLRDSLGERFEKKCLGIANPEPLFDVVQMNPKPFFNSEMFQKHRNILIVDYDKDNNENTIFQKIDYKAFPQAYFKIIANNQDSLYHIINRYSPSIIAQFYDNEHRRIIRSFSEFRNIEASKKLKNTFGFSLTLSREYLIANFNDEFAWFKKDYKSPTGQRTLNVMVYKTPFTGKGMFNENKIVELRDEISKKYIAGPTNGSYMGTEKRFPLTQKAVKIGEESLMETRGLWRLYNDFMGGSFINYCFVNPSTNDFVMIDCFVYAPNQNKRDELMQLESIVYSLKF
ncbi:MAG: DUF4837 family protein [Bacteroidales bacterium]|nr:DUF4837 family protein [Bacteroidales bacterium]